METPLEEGVGCCGDSLRRGGRVWWRLLLKRGWGVVEIPLEEGVGCGGDSFGRGGRVWWRLLWKRR